jgi:uncharacterized protein DUF4382
MIGSTTHRPRVIAWAGCVALGLTLLAGCGKDHSTSTRVGTVHMFVTDAPAAVQAVNLDIVQVAVHRTESDSVSGWEVLRQDSMTVELLSLRNGTLAALANAQVPAGTYDQVRLLLGAGSTVVVDGVTYPLTVPSGMTSGVKIVGPFTVPDNGVIELALDFDAAHSVHQTGAGTWIMTPVVRLVPLATQARIIGTITPPAGAGAVWAIAGTDTVQSTSPAPSSGMFVLAGLPGGTYNVAVSAAPGYRDTVIAGVTVAAGGTRDLGDIHLSPSGAPRM